MKRYAIITVGISASGKSTWARSYARQNKNTIISNRDDLRFSLTGATNWGEYKFNKQTESLITEIQMTTAQQAFDSGKDVIIADTNLNPHFREVLIKRLKDIGFEIEIKEFPITLEEAWKRDSLRTNGVGHHVIYKQHQDWLKHTQRRVYVPDTSLQKAILVDVDGTLAKMTNRKPFEWDKVGTDIVRPVVKQMISAFEPTHKIIILSGRDGICYKETNEWLHDNGIKFDELYLREENDNRKDAVIKEEIFWREIAHRYNVEAVFDDRPVMIRAWNELGIKNVIAVADQNVEF